MIYQYELQEFLGSLSIEQLLAGLASLLLMLVFVLELRKYLKYHSYPDLLELSGIGLLATIFFTVTGDLLLSGLAAILGLMVIGTFEVRENAIWARMMGTFTISYGFFFVMTLLGYITTKVLPTTGIAIKNILIGWGFNPEINIQQFFVGIGYNLIIWIMLVTAFLVFGRKFIIVTRFISPQMVYLVLYLVALFIILQLNLPDLAKYIAIFATNVLIYLFSGPLLTILLGIKPLDDERAKKIIKQVQEKIPTSIRKIGVVKAPILNAFAYGPWFDQRIAYITTDLSQFTDAEIRGITAHELAHLKKRHTLMLLVITAVELAIKALIDAPSTYWEYVLGSNQTWDFLSFWLFNIILFAFLLTFVKMLEGQADCVTRDLGYGIDLAESLYRLEGFYYGIAGEIGFNAQLMTGKNRSKDENIRFMGDQAYYLYRNLAPSRMTCIMNLIASHPLTSVRLALQIDHSIGAIKAGLIVWLLLLPGFRKRAIRKLQRSHEALAELLSQKYMRDFGTVDDYLEITFEESTARYFVDRYVLARPWLVDEPTFWGKITEYQLTDNIVSPIKLEMETRDGKTVTLSKGDYYITFAEPNHEYFTKEGSKVILDNIELRNGKFKKFHFINENGEKSSTRSGLGLDLADLDRKEYWLVFKEGVLQPWILKEVTIGKTFSESGFLFEDNTQTQYRMNGNELVVFTPPLLQMIKKKNWKKEKAFFDRLKRLDEPVILYDKEDFDIGAPIKITAATDSSVDVLEGRTQRELPITKLDALILDYPFHMLNIKKEMGLGSIIAFKLLNRGVQAKYIGI
ncbi:MAG: M48 family metalloprotease [Candidatus Thorarchaeota archaeon]